ncbi:hypothetical protein U91I_03487 [alpha proteobacterium U9-1i]|nr:hypothetical protein U91I_03487 [alpha proteobacterium U9-1i]
MSDLGEKHEASKKAKLSGKHNSRIESELKKLLHRRLPQSGPLAVPRPFVEVLSHLISNPKAACACHLASFRRPAGNICRSITTTAP